MKENNIRPLLYDANKTKNVGEAIICPTCGTAFYKKSYQQVFCSISCKDKFHNSMQKNKRNTCTNEKEIVSLQSQIKKEVYMKKFVVFLSPNGTSKVIEVSDYCSDNGHIKRMLSKVMFNGKDELFYSWGDFLYRVRKINNPIDIQGKLYQIVDLVQGGYYFITETSDDKCKTFESIDCSKSFLTYEECYNAMKREAMSDLAADVDIEQDFEFGQGDVYQRYVEFRENEVVWHCGEYDNKYMRYKMICR